MRFYFQDSGQKVATKCIRVASDATSQAVIETLIEKFRPDMRMLSVPEYALYEIHENGGEGYTIYLHVRVIIVRGNFFWITFFQIAKPIHIYIYLWLCGAKKKKEDTIFWESPHRIRYIVISATDGHAKCFWNGEEKMIFFFNDSADYDRRY